MAVRGGGQGRGSGFGRKVTNGISITGCNKPWQGRSKDIIDCSLADDFVMMGRGWLCLF